MRIEARRRRPIDDTGLMSDDDLDHVDPEHHGRDSGQIDGSPEDGDSIFPSSSELVYSAACSTITARASTATLAPASPASASSSVAVSAV